MTYAKLGVTQVQSVDEGFSPVRFADAMRQVPVSRVQPAVRPHDKGAASYRNGGKRLLDIAITLLLIPVVLPIVLLVSALIACDGGKPLYAQLRVGREKHPYRVWKLRSMVTDADAALQALCAADPKIANEWQQNQKLKHDPRVTRMGNVLRRFSIDELPQLWNVLKGDMSLVGPRPMTLDQQDAYRGTAYFTLRPGITGPWQVHGRGVTSFAARAVFDDDYGRTLSFRGDLKLLLATAFVVLRGTGT